MKQIYLDNGATTKTDEEVAKVMLNALVESYGNASSMHAKGRQASDLLEASRKTIANSIGAASEEIIFTGSATEANNMILFGVSRAVRNQNKEKNHIITTKIEHPSILNPLKELEKEGFKVTYLDVDKEGFVNIDQLKKTITKNTISVSVIHANHEIGTIQDLNLISKICHEKGALFHTDACQSYTKQPLNVKEQGLDLVSLNAHKLHGPKGIGAFYIKKGTPLVKTLFGGPQERKIRPGTENIPGIAGFAKSVEIALKDYDKNRKYLTQLRDYTITELLKIEKTRLNGPKGDKRNINNVNISFLGIEGEAILMRLDVEGIQVSTGSACSSQSLEPSHVIMALGSTFEEAHGSIRITISKYTTKQELDYFIKKMKEVVTSLRELSPLTNDPKLKKYSRCK